MSNTDDNAQKYEDKKNTKVSLNSRPDDNDEKPDNITSSLSDAKYNIGRVEDNDTEEMITLPGAQNDTDSDRCSTGKLNTDVIITIPDAPGDTNDSADPENPTVFGTTTTDKEIPISIHEAHDDTSLESGSSNKKTVHMIPIPEAPGESKSYAGRVENMETDEKIPLSDPNRCSIQKLNTDCLLYTSPSPRD